MVRPSVAQRRCLTLLLYATESQSTLRAAVKSLKRGSAQHPASVSVSQQPESFCSQCVCYGRWAVWDALHMAVNPQSEPPMFASGPFEA